MTEDEDDYHNRVPPAADAVARRAIVLAVVCCRSLVELDPANSAEAEALAKNALHWLRAIDLEDELTEWEAGLLVAPIGTLRDQDQINASWLSESLVVLAWALGVTDLPAYDEECFPGGVADSLGFLKPVAETVLADPRLRSTDELSDYNEFLYHVHWRLRDFSLFRKSYNFESLASKSWVEPVLKYGLRLSDKDLAIGDVPIARASEEARQTLSSITRERHRASNWLIGYGSEDFYEVPTDT